MGNRKPPIQVEKSKTLKTRLEESFAWVAIGVFAAGVLLGLTIAKDSVLLRLLGRAEPTASPGGWLPTGTPNADTKAMPHVAKSPSSTFRQIEALGGQSNCSTCTITVFKLANDVVAFATSNGLVGSAYFEKSSSRWKGHGQFADGSEHWKKTLILLELDIKQESISALLTPADGAPWEVRYAR